MASWTLDLVQFGQMVRETEAVGVDEPLSFSSFHFYCTNDYDP